MSSPLVFTCTWVDFSIDDFIYTDSRDTIVLRKFSSFVLFLGVIRLNGKKINCQHIFG
jgi:predicted nucleic acid-binding Zn finger protein